MNKNKTAISRYAILILMLFFYSYTYSMVYSFYNMVSFDILGEEGGLFHFRVIPLSFSAGLIITGLILSIKPISQNILNRSIGVVTLLTTPLILMLFNTTKPIGFLVIMYILAFFIGVECVYVNYLIVSTADSGGISRIGLINGVSLSSSILLQNVLQNSNKHIIEYSLLIIAFGLAFIELSGIGSPKAIDDRAERANGYKPEILSDKSFRKLFIVSIIVIILFEALGNILTYSLLTLMSEGNYIAFSSPRLFMAATYLVMGFIADIKDMKYIPFVSFIAVLIGILNPVLLHESSHIYLNTCIYYIIAGCINSYFVLCMWKLARGRRFAPIIAVTGRILDSVFSCIFVLPIISNLPLIDTIGIELILIIAVMLLFVFSGQFNFSEVYKPANQLRKVTPEEFADAHGFTDREKEIFLSALTFKGTMSELAKKLFISRSLLYRYINNICEKTGQENLQGVRNMYHDTAVENTNETEAAEGAPAEARDVEATSVVIGTENIESTKEFSAKVVSAREGSTKTINSEKSSDVSANYDNMIIFIKKYNLTENESMTLKSFLENPHKTQKELADIQGVTLRTIQRHLAGIRSKTGVNSLAELSALYYKESAK